MLTSPDFEILDPEHANFSGATPLLFKASTVEEEIAYAREFARQYLEEEPDKKCCIAFCGYSLYQVQHFGKQIETTVLDGDIAIGTEDIFLSDLEHAKGFEFDLVIVINCNGEVIPDPTKPQSEQFRDLSRFYVAMTRAKYQLVLSYSTTPSAYLSQLAEREYVLAADWSDYVETNAIQLKGAPPRLSEIRQAQAQIEHKNNVLDLSGPEFLYTRYAIGLSSNLIGKIRTSIAGDVTRVVAGRAVPVGWRSLRGAAESIAQFPHSRRIFGSETVEQFKLLIQKLERLEKSLE